MGMGVCSSARWTGWRDQRSANEKGEMNETQFDVCVCVSVYGQCVCECGRGEGG